MSATVKVRLLHANLGHERGENVEMDVEMAAAWCNRHLAEPLNEKSDPRRITQTRALRVTRPASENIAAIAAEAVAAKLQAEAHAAALAKQLEEAAEALVNERAAAARARTSLKAEFAVERAKMEAAHTAATAQSPDGESLWR